MELCGDAKRRGVTDAAELVRLSFEKEGGLTHVARDLQARVKDGKGWAGALRFLRETDATPVPAEVVRAERGGSYHAAAVVSMEASMRRGRREEAYIIALKQSGRQSAMKRATCTQSESFAEASAIRRARSF